MSLRNWTEQSSSSHLELCPVSKSTRNIEPMSMGHLAKIKSRIEQEMSVRIELHGYQRRFL